MSEYTKYFAVKSSSEQDVQSKLNSNKIKSVVDADKADYFFSEDCKRNGVWNWVVVSAPANSGFSNGQFFYSDQFDQIGNIFSTYIFFYQDQDFTSWRLKIKIDNTIIEKQFKTGTESLFSENEKVMFATCFDKSFKELEPFLLAGKAAAFLNSVGIPYMEMNDQDLLPDQMFTEKYSIFVDEIVD